MQPGTIPVGPGAIISFLPAASAVNVIKHPVSPIPLMSQSEVDAASLSTKKVTLEGPFREGMVIKAEQVIQERLTGIFKVIYPNGSRYEGSVKDGFIDGKGKLINKHGRVVFEGSFEKGRKEGKGIEYWPHNGAMKSEGEWSQGELVGDVIMGSFDGVTRFNGTMVVQDPSTE